MKTQLFFDLTATVPHPSVYFRESDEVEESLEELQKHDVAVLEINGAALSSDDVAEWIPAKGHIVLIRGSEQLWRTAPRLAGVLTELWQFATVTRHAAIHLIFVW